ncbi:MAG: penicillin-binding protein 2, partial [Candidatus Omnitrophica bacterium]|nr:penicillin-binding protein 2 [Candidatus Omnitrophota bacterium]
MRPLAININADSLYAVPAQIKDKEKVIRLIQPILNLEYSYLKDRLYQNRSFIWIARKITAQQAAKIKALKIKGLGLIRENRRAYPNGYLGAHVIGFTNIDNRGLEGLEASYEKYLKGTSGWAFFLRDARQNKLNISESMLAPQDGLDVVLNIDEVIQYIAENELDKAFKKYNAKGGSIIVLDPYSGAVLALANRPTFDLNFISLSDSDARRNRAICDLFEPGSVFKIVTAAAALEEKVALEDDKFFCEEGSYKVANHILHDHQPRGWLTFKEVFEQSSNIGTTKIAQMLGPQTIYRYAKLFGFAASCGIDLPGEAKVILRAPKKWPLFSKASISIGQEIATTSLHLVTAASAIFNNGKLVQPYIVKFILDAEYKIYKEEE